MGMHDLTEQEIHEQWTPPQIEVWSEVLGIELAISDWQEDGMVTLSVPAFSAHGMWGFCGEQSSTVMHGTAIVSVDAS
jgi:hypothetical protein